MSAIDNLHFYGDDLVPEVIAWFDDFDGMHRWRALSNFFEGEPFYMPVIDEYFKTGEHAYQFFKAQKPEEARRILNAQGPGEAKALGNNCKLRKDWEAIKYDVMMAVLRNKFTLERYEGKVLKQTLDALLVEGTYWGDNVWGVALNERDPALLAPGRNWLGTMLMARRAELRAESNYGRYASHRTELWNTHFAIHGR